MGDSIYSSKDRFCAWYQGVEGLGQVGSPTPKGPTLKQLVEPFATIDLMRWIDANQSARKQAVKHHGMLPDSTWLVPSGSKLARYEVEKPVTGRTVLPCLEPTEPSEVFWLVVCLEPSATPRNGDLLILADPQDRDRLPYESGIPREVTTVYGTPIRLSPAQVGEIAWGAAEAFGALIGEIRRPISTIGNEVP